MFKINICLVAFFFRSNFAGGLRDTKDEWDTEEMKEMLCFSWQAEWCHFLCCSVLSVFQRSSRRDFSSSWNIRSSTSTSMCDRRTETQESLLGEMFVPAARICMELFCFCGRSLWRPSLTCVSQLLLKFLLQMDRCHLLNFGVSAFIRKKY